MIFIANKNIIIILTEAIDNMFNDWFTFDVYKRFAIKARSTGDNMGRKILFGPSGVDDSNFDYVYSLYASTMSEFGESADNFMKNLAGTPEADALSDISSCSNARTYVVKNIKQAGQY